MIDKKCNEINNNGTQDMSATIVEKCFPRLVVFNIPEEITLENASGTMREQNPDVVWDGDSIVAKYIWKNRNNSRRNLVIEINPALRKRFLERKIRLSWNICPCDDYRNKVSDNLIKSFLQIEKLCQWINFH